MLTLFDIIFIITALIILVIGISRLKTLRTFERKEIFSGDWAGLIGYLAGHKKIIENPVTGTLHFIIFWGFLFFMLMIVPAQLGMIFPKSIAHGISFVMDVTGLLMLAAVLYFLANRLRADKTKVVPGKFHLLFFAVDHCFNRFFIRRQPSAFNSSGILNCFSCRLFVFSFFP